MDSYILKPEITGKQQSQNVRKTQKTTTYWKPKKYWIPKYKQNGGSVFAFTCQGWGSRPYTPVRHTTVVDLCCILSLYKYRITGIQSYKIVSVALAYNIRCILHQSCPMKTRNITPMRNPVILRITLCPVVGLGPIVGCSALFIGPHNTYCCGPCLLRCLRGIKPRLV